MRRWWIVCALGATACFGGQTGEITELTACHEPIGTAAVDEPSDAGRSARDQLGDLTTTLETELAWQDGATSTPASIAFDLSGEPGTLLGGAECDRPWLEVPVTITVRTADRALDETLEGVATLTGSNAASVSASIAIGAMNGALELASDSGLDPERAALRVDLSSERDALHGQLSLLSGTEDASDRLLASF